MTRYVKPNGGRKGEIAEKMVEAGDGIAFTAISLIVMSFLVPGALGLAFGASLWWLFLLSPIAFPVWAWSTYFITTSKMGRGDYGLDKMYNRAYNAYARTIGDHTQELAKPLIEKIYMHALARHAGSDCRSYNDYLDCRTCKERLDVLEQLVPPVKSVNSKDDIELAKQFLAARKELTGA